MKLGQLSIRARVAYAATCLELLLKKKFSSNKKEEEAWDFLLEKIWTYTQINPGTWHYTMAELTPFSIEEDLSFAEKSFDDLTYENYILLSEAYKNTAEDVKKIVDLIFEIGTLDLYTSIVNNSPRTQEMLKEILLIVKANGLDIPDLANYKRLTIDENEGWGRIFKKSDLG